MRPAAADCCVCLCVGGREWPAEIGQSIKKKLQSKKSGYDTTKNDATIISKRACLKTGLDTPWR